MQILDFSYWIRLIKLFKWIFFFCSSWKNVMIWHKSETSFDLFANTFALLLKSKNFLFKWGKCLKSYWGWFWFADGTPCQSLHTRRSSTKTKHEVYCGCTNDTFVFNRGLGCWFFLWKSSSSPSHVRKVAREGSCSSAMPWQVPHEDKVLAFVSDMSVISKRVMLLLTTILHRLTWYILSGFSCQPPKKTKGELLKTYNINQCEMNAKNSIT